MPGFPIIDAHVHLIEPARVPLSWGDAAPSINRPHRMAELDAAATRTEIDAIVFVEVDVVAGRHLDEVAMVESMALDDPRIGAIVAHAPLHVGDAVQPDLDLLAGRPLVRGVRRLIQDEAADWCLNDDFVAGVRQLGPRDLHFEICIRHPQMAAATGLIDRCPDVRFILDHIGKPDIKNGELEPWRRQLRAMAERPNICCKLSGLVTEADHQSWRSSDLRPYIDHVVEVFGFDRLIFGSDWPVVNLAGDYERWIATLDDALHDVALDDLEKLYSANAKSFYRIG